MIIPVRRIGLLALTVASLTPFTSGVIMEVREYHGKQVMCVHSGLVGVARSCGTEGYARVFTGIVRSAVEKGDTDKLLEIVPDEVFVGDSTDATAITNQACLHANIQAGDKWLFYLSRQPKSDALVLSYDSPSKPTVDAEDDISMLRDLGHIKNAGILVGTIWRLGETDELKTVPFTNQRVIAKSVANGAEYATYTNEKGLFKFELPVGEYDVTTAPEYGLREVDDLFFSMQGSVPRAERQMLGARFRCEADYGL